MEEDLIDLEKELNELNNQDDGWESLKKWENNFWMFIEVYKSKYKWCEKEFQSIQSLKDDKDFWADDKITIPSRNTIRGHVDSYKKLFKKKSVP